MELWNASVTVSSQENIVLAFNEVVQFGAGTLHLLGGIDGIGIMHSVEVDIEALAAASSGGLSLLRGKKLVLAAQTLCTVAPNCTDLNEGMSYFVKTTTEGVMKDRVGNKMPILDSRDHGWSFLVDDGGSEAYFLYERPSGRVFHKPDVVMVGGVRLIQGGAVAYIYFNERITSGAGALKLVDCGRDFDCATTWDNAFEDYAGPDAPENTTLLLEYADGTHDATGGNEYGVLRIIWTPKFVDRLYELTIPAGFVRETSPSSLAGPIAERKFLLHVGHVVTPEVGRDVELDHAGPSWGQCSGRSTAYIADVCADGRWYNAAPPGTAGRATPQDGFAGNAEGFTVVLNGQGLTVGKYYRLCTDMDGPSLSRGYGDSGQRFYASAIAVSRPGFVRTALNYVDGPRFYRSELLTFVCDYGCSSTAFIRLFAGRCEDLPPWRGTAQEWFSMRASGWMTVDPGLKEAATPGGGVFLSQIDSTFLKAGVKYRLCLDLDNMGPLPAGDTGLSVHATPLRGLEPLIAQRSSQLKLMMDCEYHPLCSTASSVYLSVMDCDDDIHHVHVEAKGSERTRSVYFQLEDTTKFSAVMDASPLRSGSHYHVCIDIDGISSDQHGFVRSGRIYFDVVTSANPMALSAEEPTEVVIECEEGCTETSVVIAALSCDGTSGLIDSEAVMNGTIGERSPVASLRKTADGKFKATFSAKQLIAGRKYRLCADLDGPGGEQALGDTGIEMFVTPIAGCPECTMRAREDEHVVLTCTDCWISQGRLYWPRLVEPRNDSDEVFLNLNATQLNFSEPECNGSANNTTCYSNNTTMNNTTDGDLEDVFGLQFNVSDHLILSDMLSSEIFLAKENCSIGPRQGRPERAFYDVGNTTCNISGFRVFHEADCENMETSFVGGPRPVPEDRTIQEHSWTASLQEAGPSRWMARVDGRGLRAGFEYIVCLDLKKPEQEGSHWGDSGQRAFLTPVSAVGRNAIPRGRFDLAVTCGDTVLGCLLTDTPSTKSGQMWLSPASIGCLKANTRMASSTLLVNPAVPSMASVSLDSSSFSYGQVLRLCTDWGGNTLGSDVGVSLYLSPVDSLEPPFIDRAPNQRFAVGCVAGCSTELSVYLATHCGSLPADKTGAAFLQLPRLLSPTADRKQWFVTLDGTYLTPGVSLALCADADGKGNKFSVGDTGLRVYVRGLWVPSPIVIKAGTPAQQVRVGCLSGCNQADVHGKGHITTDCVATGSLDRAPSKMDFDGSWGTFVFDGTPYAQGMHYKLCAVLEPSSDGSEVAFVDSLLSVYASPFKAMVPDRLALRADATTTKLELHCTRNYCPDVATFVRLIAMGHRCATGTAAAPADPTAAGRPDGSPALAQRTTSAHVLFATLDTSRLEPGREYRLCSTVGTFNEGDTGIHIFVTGVTRVLTPAIAPGKAQKLCIECERCSEEALLHLISPEFPCTDWQSMPAMHPRPLVLSSGMMEMADIYNQSFGLPDNESSLLVTKFFQTSDLAPPTSLLASHQGPSFWCAELDTALLTIGRNYTICLDMDGGPPASGFEELNYSNETNQTAEYLEENASFSRALALGLFPAPYQDMQPGASGSVFVVPQDLIDAGISPSVVQPKSGFRRFRIRCGRQSCSQLSSAYAATTCEASLLSAIVPGKSSTPANLEMLAGGTVAGIQTQGWLVAIDTQYFAPGIHYQLCLDVDGIGPAVPGDTGLVIYASPLPRIRPLALRSLGADERREQHYAGVVWINGEPRLRELEEDMNTASFMQEIKLVCAACRQGSVAFLSARATCELFNKAEESGTTVKLSTEPQGLSVSGKVPYNWVFSADVRVLTMGVTYKLCVDVDGQGDDARPGTGTTLYVSPILRMAFETPIRRASRQKLIFECPECTAKATVHLATSCSSSEDAGPLSPEAPLQFPEHVPAAGDGARAGGFIQTTPHTSRVPLQRYSFETQALATLQERLEERLKMQRTTQELGSTPFSSGAGLPIHCLRQPSTAQGCYIHGARQLQNDHTRTVTAKHSDVALAHSTVLSGTAFAQSSNPTLVRQESATASIWWSAEVDAARLADGHRYRLCMDVDGTGLDFKAGDTGLSAYVTPVQHLEVRPLSRAPAQRVAFLCMSCVPGRSTLRLAESCAEEAEGDASPHAVLQADGIVRSDAQGVRAMVDASKLTLGATYWLCLDLDGPKNHEHAAGEIGEVTISAVDIVDPPAVKKARGQQVYLHCLDCDITSLAHLAMECNQSQLIGRTEARNLAMSPLEAFRDQPRPADAPEGAWFHVMLDTMLLEVGRSYKLCVDLDGKEDSWRSHDTGHRIHITGIDVLVETAVLALPRQKATTFCDSGACSRGAMAALAQDCSKISRAITGPQPPVHTAPVPLMMAKPTTGASVDKPALLSASASLGHGQVRGGAIGQKLPTGSWYSAGLDGTGLTVGARYHFCVDYDGPGNLPYASTGKTLLVTPLVCDGGSRITAQREQVVRVTCIAHSPSSCTQATAFLSTDCSRRPEVEAAAASVRSTRARSGSRNNGDDVFFTPQVSIESNTQRSKFWFTLDASGLPEGSAYSLCMDIDGPDGPEDVTDLGCWAYVSGAISVEPLVFKPGGKQEFSIKCLEMQRQTKIQPLPGPPPGPAGCLVTSYVALCSDSGSMTAIGSDLVRRSEWGTLTRTSHDWRVTLPTTGLSSGTFYQLCIDRDGAGFVSGFAPTGLQIFASDEITAEPKIIAPASGVTIQIRCLRLCSTSTKVFLAHTCESSRLDGAREAARRAGMFSSPPEYSNARTPMVSLEAVTLGGYKGSWTATLDARALHLGMRAKLCMQYAPADIDAAESRAGDTGVSMYIAGVSATPRAAVFRGPRESVSLTCGSGCTAGITEAFLAEECTNVAGWTRDLGSRAPVAGVAPAQYGIGGQDIVSIPTQGARAKIYGQPPAYEATLDTQTLRTGVDYRLCVDHDGFNGPMAPTDTSLVVHVTPITLRTSNEASTPGGPELITLKTLANQVVQLRCAEGCSMSTRVFIIASDLMCNAAHPMTLPAAWLATDGSVAGAGAFGGFGASAWKATLDASSLQPGRYRLCVDLDGPVGTNYKPGDSGIEVNIILPG
eukprot:TRINITY_DN58015_c0_g7_i1.p1 TRINITY_DN58015_c0_g7~~TRINITY_DN58015_c0_g7_i1.p1  ORF type:complete len:3302 (-),score=512.29 TRINITY_DN58015_c0_g7_i1:262-9471(-)